MYDQLKRIEEYVDLEKNLFTLDKYIKKAAEELGEVATASLVEEGLKDKELTENTMMESCDLMILAVCIYIRSGGAVEDLSKNLDKKLDKWQQILKKKGILDGTV